MTLPCPRRLRRLALTLTLAAATAAGAFGAPAPAAAQQQPYGAFGTDQHSCDRGALSQILSTSRGNVVGSAAGAALGGLLGSNIGKGSGQTLATIVGVLGGALAGGYVGRSMDPADQACVAQTLENTPTGQSVAWRNPDNGSSYWVTPTRTYQASNGDPCRDYVTQAVVNSQRQETNGAACREPDGRWATVQPSAAPPPAAPPPPGAAPLPWQQGAAQAPPPAPPPAPRERAMPAALSPDTIREVQQRLRETGFYEQGNIDGLWGPRTASALENFQHMHGLRPTGQLDPRTMAALGLGSDGTSPPAR